MIHRQDTAREREVGERLRFVSIRRDLGPIADLLELAFADERSRAHGSAGGFGLLQGYGPLIAFLSPFSPSLRDCFNGYVWEEKGRIVGNASVSRLNGAADVWIIGNVGVHPDFRRHGIARQLTARAIEHAREEGARMVVLDVREENTPALTLYASMGFRPAGGHVDLLTSRVDTLRLGSSGWSSAGQASAGPSPGGDAAARLEVESLRRPDWQAVALLASACEEGLAAIANPWVEADFKPGPIGRLARLLGEWLLGQTSADVGAWAGGRLVAWAALRPERLSDGHRIHLLVLPPWQGQAEEALFASLLGRLRGGSAGPLAAQVPLADWAAIALLEGAGFRRGTALLRLAKPLSPGCSPRAAAEVTGVSETAIRFGAAQPPPWLLRSATHAVAAYFASQVVPGVHLQGWVATLVCLGLLAVATGLVAPLLDAVPRLRRLPRWLLTALAETLLWLTVSLLARAVGLAFQVDTVMAGLAAALLTRAVSALLARLVGT